MIRKRLPKKTKSARSRSKLEAFDESSVIEIERISHDAKGIGFSKGYTVSVPFTIPGEKISIQHAKINDRMVYADIKSIDLQSDNRVEPKCEYFKSCGGCDFQHVDYKTQIELKQQQFLWQFKDVLFKDLKKKKKSSIDAPLISEPFEYRHRIRLTVKNEKIGFLKSGSNEVVEIDRCSITHPLIQKQIRLSRDASILKLHSLQSVEWLVDDNQQIAIRLILKKAPSQAKLTQAIDWLRQNEVHNYRFEFTQNVIEGGKQLVQIHEDLSYQYLPGQFTQVNSNVNQLMLKQAQDWILQCFESDNIKEAKALDLFCGMGNFTLLLAKYFKQTIGIESSSDSIQCAKQNAQENQKRIELNELKFIEQDLFANNWGQAIARHQFDLVVLDPPRAGAKQICTDIEQLSSQYLLYISCNQSTLLRDTILLQERGYAIERANIMDMFAQTHHIETMVLFKKQ